ncbi:MAG: hypothetical protein WC371_03185 [Parachlamydiales bacterium]
MGGTKDLVWKAYTSNYFQGATQFIAGAAETSVGVAAGLYSGGLMAGAAEVSAGVAAGLFITAA